MLPQTGLEGFLRVTDNTFYHSPHSISYAIAVPHEKLNGLIAKIDTTYMAQQPPQPNIRWLYIWPRLQVNRCMDDTNRFSSPWKSPCPSNLHYSKRICLVERFASCTMESTTDSRIRAPRPIVCVRDLQIRFHGKSPPPFKSRILWRFFLSLNLPLSADLSLTCENLVVPSPPKVGWYRLVRHPTKRAPLA